ncbi:MAG: hypothetical protein HYV34_01785 [Candidatus Kerfeldbacteria bacterium]|nr:hypothetical protein [Candidatus Kerfeldbacteria bacterium]
MHERVQAILTVQKDAIEVGINKMDRLTETIDEETFEQIRTFEYRSVHAPVDVRYPSQESETLMPKLLHVIEKVQAHTVVVHPDIVDDFTYLAECFGDKLAIENSDNRKSFGQTVEDMERVFEAIPKAGWICDVNHFYTIDSTMKIADAFHERFEDRLRHYHISAYQGHHNPFVCYEPGSEDAIIRGIKRTDIPLIHEGGTSGINAGLLTRERNYILERLQLIHKVLISSPY